MKFFRPRPTDMVKATMNGTKAPHIRDIDDHGKIMYR